jgi:hypothetical protein
LALRLEREDLGRLASCSRQLRDRTYRACPADAGLEYVQAERGVPPLCSPFAAPVAALSPAPPPLRQATATGSVARARMRD